MRKNLIKTIVAILFLLAGSSAPVLADGTGIPPYCPPGQVCNPLAWTGGSPQTLRDGIPPFCPPGQVCN